ncbi:MAG: ribonuclease HI family protein [Candidatus Peribacteraceae bacterium]|jgi:ribonuclease HI|nr:ribonuclease HI family protein [Candidatus Peribacteraceae bacterium]
MIRLPASLERKLQQLFARADDRNRFVTEVVTVALEQYDLQQQREEQMSVGGTLHLFTDGGSRGNPGQSAIGVIIEDPVRGEVIREHCERIGIQTNNVAEYQALIEGLKLAKRYHPNRLICHLDSELIVKQLNGEYKVKMATLKPFFEEIQEISQHFDDVDFVHIPRSDNYRADALVNKALDEHPAPHYERP